MSRSVSLFIFDPPPPPHSNGGTSASVLGMRKTQGLVSERRSREGRRVRSVERDIAETIRGAFFSPPRVWLGSCGSAVGFPWVCVRPLLVYSRRNKRRQRNRNVSVSALKEAARMSLRAFSQLDGVSDGAALFHFRH